MIFNTVTVAKVLVSDELGRLLTVRRSHTAPVRALCWDLPGGIVMSDEQPPDAARRETVEETGLKLGTLTRLTEYSESAWGRKIVTIVYSAQSEGGAVELSYEHDRYQWIEKSQAQSLSLPQEYKSAVTLLEA